MPLYFGALDPSLQPRLQALALQTNSEQTADSDKMARICLLALVAGLLLEARGLPTATQEDGGGKKINK